MDSTRPHLPILSIHFVTHVPLRVPRVCILSCPGLRFSTSADNAAAVWCALYEELLQLPGGVLP